MSALPALRTSDFAAFFRSLHNYDPFPWQSRLLGDLVSGTWDSRHGDAKNGDSNPQRWPAAMALPTASGKTACIDIALFHLALQADLSAEKRAAPRRIFFCVDRRVIVDEAHERARAIAKRLREAETGTSNDNAVLARVAARLRHLAGDNTAAPLAVFQLRGGTFRDDAWATSPLQPTVICTTVDQLGSRLLFRGYGVSPHSAAIHAGLAANDALILLDEAHCAEPFRQTLDAVRLFRNETWCEPAHALKTSFAFVEMSATPRSAANPFKLDDSDRGISELSRRLSACKSARLDESARNTASDEFAAELVERVVELMGRGSKRIAVMVNRVPTAQAVYRRLLDRRPQPATDSEAEPGDSAAKKQKSPIACDPVLMIGRMRPLDRDDHLRQWQPKLRATPGSDEQRETHEKPIVVVATQCLEVGANLDFDALITEAASLDALRQRFGRLNRLGHDSSCHAVVVAPKDSIKDDADDPIYGPAIANTWKWMQIHAESSATGDAPSSSPDDKKKGKKPKKATADGSPKSIDFGIDALDAKLPADPEERAKLLRDLSPPASDAPVMLPAHLDLWCQTAPIPDPDPDVSIFLHGPQRGVPTVSVCWRADLGENPEQWSEIVSLLPPSSPECMPVPLHLVRKWMQPTSAEAVDTGDVEQATVGDNGDDRPDGQNGDDRRVLLWRGADRKRRRADHGDGANARYETRWTTDPGKLNPGDVIVIPAALAPTCTFGHLPGFTTNANGSAETCVGLDRAEHANLIARQRVSLRLTPQLVASWPDPRDEQNQPAVPARGELLSILIDSETRERLGERDVAEQLRGALRQLGGQLRSAAKAGRIGREWAWLRVLAAATTTRSLRAEVAEHPAGGIVVRSRRRIGERALRAAGLLPGDIELDGGDEDERSFSAHRPVPFAAHVLAVAARARALTDACGATTVTAAVARAAELHDHGKLDPRFQAFMLGIGCRGVNGRAALAKSGRSPTSGEMRADARRAGLPAGFRHEMLSMQIAEHATCHEGKPLLDGLTDELRDLVLHLIASHHGYARPLAPVVIDETPPALPAFELKTANRNGHGLLLQAVDASRRAAWEQVPAHRLDSGVCDRFWTLTRRYGWWGLAYLESILRLADRAVSREEQENVAAQPALVTASRPQALVSKGAGR